MLLVSFVGLNILFRKVCCSGFFISSPKSRSSILSQHLPSPSPNFSQLLAPSTTLSVVGSGNEIYHRRVLPGQSRNLFLPRHYKQKVNKISLVQKKATTNIKATRINLSNDVDDIEQQMDDFVDQSPSPVLSTETGVAVYQQRWIQLLYLSLLALLSDWICFSVAAAPDAYENAFPTHTVASIIDLFLFTNVVSCFLVTDVVRTIGLQRSIHGSAILMTIGCWLRCGGIGFLGSTPSILASYPYIVIGTICVGIAQPFFQCTPPLLSATWFPSNERSTSTAIALNFNQVGIATAFLVGGAMAVNSTGLENYFGLIAIICTIVTIGTLLQFQNEPLKPPSQSELEKKLTKKETVPPFLTSARLFFTKRGFTHALAAFICSISITNVVGAFIDDILGEYLRDQNQLDLAGAGFEFAIVLGGVLIGGYVDKTKRYKLVTIACLIAASIFVLPLGFVSTTSMSSLPVAVVLTALFGLGLVVGPVQPINAELAVDVTYPGDETAVESIQQIGGNMISALLIPLAEYLKHEHIGNMKLSLPIPTTTLTTTTPEAIDVPETSMLEITGDIDLLFVLTVATLAYFITFDAPLARSQADE